MKRQEKAFLQRILCAVVMGVAVVSVRAETLVWDPNPEPDIAGYRVFYGEVNSSPTIVDVGNVTSRQFPSLLAGRSYFFYVTAYNTADLESAPSETLNYTKPGGPNQPPTISSIQDRTLPVNSPPITINFSVNDPDTSPANLVVTGSSSNPALIPTGALTFGGSGTSRTVSFAPEPNQSGQATITLTVSDGAATASESFMVTVLPGNQPPLVQITSPANGTSYQAPATIIVNANASDPDGSVARVEFYNGGNLLGSDTSSPFSLTMNNVGQGSLALQARAFDNAGASAISQIVNVTVDGETPGVHVVDSNWLNMPVETQSGTFRAEFDAVPTPAPLDCVVGFSDDEVSEYSSIAAIARFNDAGFIDARNGGSYEAMAPISYSANVKYHFRMEINVPSRTYSIYVTPEGGTEQVVGANFLFRSDQSSVAQLDNLAARVGTSSGTVELSAVEISGGTAQWPPTISSIQDQMVLEDSSATVLGFTIGDPDTPASSLALSVSSSNPELIANDRLVLGGSGTNRTVSFQPEGDQSGSSQVTVTVSDGQASASTGFTVTVTEVNDVPTIANVPDQTIPLNSSTGELPVFISDEETPATQLTLTAQSSNPTLVPQSGLILGGSDANRTIVVRPAANQSGEAVITLTVSDGAATATETFRVVVNSVRWYTIGPSWFNLPVQAQYGLFTLRYDAIPSAGLIDGVMGLSDGPAGEYSSLAAIARFNDNGYIDARDGDSYSAATRIPYSANVQYHFRLEINLFSGTYSVFVTPAGGSEVTVGFDYRFRTDQAGVERLNKLAGYVQSGGTLRVGSVELASASSFATASLGALVEPVRDALLLSSDLPLFVTENFEGPGYQDENWFELNDPNESFATAQLEGDFALNTRAGSQAYYEVGGVTELNTSFQLMWQERPLLHTIVDLSDENGEPAAFVWYSDGVLHISHGNARASARFQAIPGVPYHFWVEWKAATEGSNGEMQVYLSRTEVKPLTPISRIRTGTGTAVERIHFGGAAPDSPSLLLDGIRISEGAAGGFSEL